MTATTTTRRWPKCRAGQCQRDVVYGTHCLEHLTGSDLDLWTEDQRRRRAAMRSATPAPTAALSSPAPVSQVPTPAVRQVEDDLVREEREHRERMERLRRDADKRIADSRAHQDALLKKHQRTRELRRIESMEQRRQNDRVELARQQSRREFLREMEKPLSDVERRRLADELREIVPNTPDPLVHELVKWIVEVCIAEGIDVRVCADPRLANGAAVRKLRYIEVAPLQSVRQCVIWAHEVGHVLHASVVDERRVKVNALSSVSVPSEIAAWRWVLDHSPAWTEEMHADMTRFLSSYKQYAIPDETAAIDDLCSPATLQEQMSRRQSRSSQRLAS